MKSTKIFFCIGIMSSIFLLSGCKQDPVTSVVSSDGVNIKFTNKGSGAPTLVFIHGWSNQRQIWDDQVSHFAQKYSAIAIDLPGSGDSGNNRSEWTIEAFGNDVASVINTSGINEVVLVGFSMGASVVIEAANILQDKVIGVVLVDGMKDPDTKLPPEALVVIDSVFFDLVNDMTNEKLVRLGFYKKNQEAAFKRLYPMYDGVSHVGWKESLIGAFNWGNEKRIESLQHLKVPIIAINSDKEPTNIAAFEKYVPSFEAKIMTDVGHLIFWDNPEEFNRLLEESIQNFLIMKN